MKREGFGSKRVTTMEQQLRNLFIDSLGESVGIMKKTWVIKDKKPIEVEK